MDSTIYFPTLDQYKCNPALVIQSAPSTPVQAPANARILEIGANEEIGNYVTLDLGNDYTAVCGQLKEIDVLAGEYVEKGALLGYVAERRNTTRSRETTCILSSCTADSR